MLIVDSREKKWDHIRDYLSGRGYEYRVEKLNTGDYVSDSSPGIVIDRKKDLNELATNLCTSDSNRFWREMRRSKQEGILLIVLVEHGGKIKEHKDVLGWRSKYSKITGQQLLNEMCNVEVAYGVKFMFTNKRKTASMIVELLNLKQ